MRLNCLQLKAGCVYQLHCQPPTVMLVTYVGRQVVEKLKHGDCLMVLSTEADGGDIVNMTILGPTGIGERRLYHSSIGPGDHWFTMVWEAP